MFNIMNKVVLKYVVTRSQRDIVPSFKSQLELVDQNTLSLTDEQDSASNNTVPSGIYMLLGALLIIILLFCLLIYVLRKYVQLLFAILRGYLRAIAHLGDGSTDIRISVEAEHNGATTILYSQCERIALENEIEVANVVPDHSVQHGSMVRASDDEIFYDAESGCTELSISSSKAEQHTV